MAETLWQIFGWVLVGVAGGLAVWEQVAYAHRNETAWLVTRRRYYRRMVIAVVLAAVGVLISVQTRQMISPQDVGAFTVFVLVVTGLCLLLFILAAVDAYDIAKSAAQHALNEASHSLDEQTLEQLKLPPQDDERTSK